MSGINNVFYSLLLLFTSPLLVPNANQTSGDVRVPLTSEAVAGGSSRPPSVIVVSSVDVAVSVAAPATTSTTYSDTACLFILRLSPLILSIPCTPRSRRCFYPLSRICICMYSSKSSGLVKNPTFPPLPHPLVWPS